MGHLFVASQNVWPTLFHRTKHDKILIPIVILMDNENINQAIKLYPNNQIVEESFMFAVKYLRDCHSCY